MKELIKDDMKFLSFNDDNVSINFSTAFNKIDFKKFIVNYLKKYKINNYILYFKLNILFLC